MERSFYFIMYIICEDIGGNNQNEKGEAKFKVIFLVKFLNEREEEEPEIFFYV